MPVASTVLSATVLVAQFLSQVESSPQLQASMTAADGDIPAIVAIANTAGFAFDSEQFSLAYQELSSTPQPSVARAHPEVYFSETNIALGHPEVYFAERSIARGHPEVYFANTNLDTTIARGHPEVYFAQENVTVTVQRGHPEVYFTQA